MEADPNFPPGPFDIGAPREPRTANTPFGNVDFDFDDFSPENPATSSGANNVHAFQLVQVAIDDLCVRQGTIKNVIPTINGTELAVDHTENSLSLPGTGTREYWIKVTLDGSTRNITAVTIENDLPDTTDPITEAWLLLGSVETDSGDIVDFNSNLSGSQELASCGATHYFGVV